MEETIAPSGKAYTSWTAHARNKTHFIKRRKSLINKEHICWKKVRKMKVSKIKKNFKEKLKLIFLDQRLNFRKIPVGKRRTY